MEKMWKTIPWENCGKIVNKIVWKNMWKIIAWKVWKTITHGKKVKEQSHVGGLACCNKSGDEVMRGPTNSKTWQIVEDR